MIIKNYFLVEKLNNIFGIFYAVLCHILLQIFNIFAWRSLIINWKMTSTLLKLPLAPVTIFHTLTNPCLPFSVTYFKNSPFLKKITSRIICYQPSKRIEDRMVSLFFAIFANIWAKYKLSVFKRPLISVMDKVYPCNFPKFT